MSKNAWEAEIVVIITAFSMVSASLYVNPGKEWYTWYLQYLFKVVAVFRWMLFQNWLNVWFVLENVDDLMYILPFEQNVENVLIGECF